MGRLELAGIDPYVTPPARLWRALWALFVEYKTTFDSAADEHVNKLWSIVSGRAVLEVAPTETVATDGQVAPAVAPRASTPPRFEAPIDPDTGQPRRPTAAEREAWAKAYASTGPLAADAARTADAGKAPQVGRPERD